MPKADSEAEEILRFLPLREGELQALRTRSGLTSTRHTWRRCGGPCARRIRDAWSWSRSWLAWSQAWCRRSSVVVVVVGAAAGLDRSPDLRRGGLGRRTTGPVVGAAAWASLIGDLGDGGAVNGRLGDGVAAARRWKPASGCGSHRRKRGGGQHQHGDQDQFAHVKSPLFDGESLRQSALPLM